jgi:hypothetical protein
MVPGDVIAGDVRIKLNGPCNEVESYELGLHYKEKIFWKFSPEFESRSMNANRDVSHQVRMPFQNSGNPHYHEMQLALQLAALQNSGQNEDLWSVHEEERIAFEIKTPLASTEGADPLSRSFTSRFGILVPNTNYPPGLDYRNCVSGRFYMGHVDAIHSESIYEYFVQIRFSNGVIWKVPAGITAFTPFYLSTEDKAPNVNVSLAPADIWNSRPRERSSNYTVEMSFPEGASAQNSPVDITATVHRTGYTNRTDLPVELCASLESTSEWHPQELKNRSTFMPFIKLLVPSLTPSMGPSMQRSRDCPPFSRSVCKEVKFAAAPGNLTREGHISSTSSEPVSLSLHVGQDVVRAFSTYYQKLGQRVDLNLHIKPDPSEQCNREIGIPPWERQAGWMDESDYDWVPWLSPMQTLRQRLTGNTSVSFIPMQNQRPVQTTPVHYLSNEARQPVFVDVSDIADLRSMTSEERDLIAPIAQPSIRVLEGDPGHPDFYFDCNKRQPIYVGDTWLNKVLSVAVEG